MTCSCSIVPTDVQFVVFPFPVEVTIGFSQEAYTRAEDGGFVTLRVTVLQGELGIPVFVNFSTVDGTAIGMLLCS